MRPGRCEAAFRGERIQVVQVLLEHVD